MARNKKRDNEDEHLAPRRQNTSMLIAASNKLKPNSGDEQNVSADKAQVIYF